MQLTKHSAVQGFQQMAEDTPGRGVLHQQLQERLPMQGNDSRRDFYTMVEGKIRL